MYRFKLFIDFEKEEKWLAQMASDGYHLQRVSFGYQFRRGEPEKTTIKIDYRVFKNKEDYIDYCTMFEDSGWKHLAGTRSSGFQYFQKMDDTAEDDIFSDQASKAVRYKRYARISLESAYSFFPLLAIFYVTDIIDFEAFINPKALYFTPGLWDKTGTAFWFAFLFETPFALMRGFAWCFIPITIILYLFFGYKSNKLYAQYTK
ncbi:MULTISPECIES: DUF2812 domain-containing protein [unclassified Oceanobacillus]|uniref:DUF2812 domain-containing protein n=1 Tax=unclassified Oceanobacillus TaxID=2630292 RepID=UPI00300E1BD8